MKQQSIMTIQVSGQGDTKQRAFASALAQVQGTILKNTQDVILRIEPLDIVVIKASSTVTMEKFLFFFLPRKREVYTVVLDISVDITLIKVDSVEFHGSL